MSGTCAILVNAAFAYTARGFRVVPVPPRKKGPVHDGWQNLRLGFDDLHHHFNGAPGNIGVLLGEPSGDLVDVDLDCPEAIELADEFLPPTHVVTGRPSAPGSHRWYLASEVKTKKHRDPVTRKMIVELRSTGAQTLVGPSVHPSGEAYDHLDGIPPTVDGEELAAQVAALAEAVIRRRHGEPEPPGPHGRTSATRGPTRARPLTVDDDDRVLRRAEAYLDAMPPAISGSGGHNATYAAATALVHGFALSPQVALRMLHERFNPRCVPPWSDRDLEHKIDDATSKPHERPHGWLRDAVTVETNDVDLSRFGTACDDDDDPGRSLRPLDPGPLPVHLLHVPGFIDAVVQHNLATATRSQPVLALAAAICLQSVLAARKVRDERGNRPNVYCIGIAASGAGKEHARKVNKNILFAADLIEHDGSEDLASDAGLLAAVEIEPAILFQIDEFGRFLRTIGDPKKAPHLFNVLTALMKLYSCADTIFRGKAYADPKRNKVIDQPCVSVYGTTVPEHFFESLTADSLSDGFIARLLVFEADTTPARQRVHAAPPPDALVATASWWGSFKPGGNLASDHPEPSVITTTPEAGTIFDQLASQVDARIAEPDAAASALWSRAEEKACRLALIYACSRDHRSPVIDVDAASWACELAEYLTRRMLFVAHEWVADGQFDAQQKRVLRVVRRAGGKISRSELCRKTQWLKQRERQEVIDNMLETGQLRHDVVATKTKSGVHYAIP